MKLVSIGNLGIFLNSFLSDYYMENKNVGWLILGISVLIIGIIFLFNNAMKEIVVMSCGYEHSLTCPMNTTIEQQTYLSLGIVGILIIISLVLIFSKPQKEVVVKTVQKTKPKKKFNISDLKPEEKRAFELIKENKAIFQADLIEKMNIGKVKMSRILDRLEGRNFIERKRRGMNNVIILKED